MTGGGVLPVTCKGALSRTGIPGHKYCLNPYVGCRHACVYCYAPVILRFSPVAVNWGKAVHAKVNIPQALERELSRKRDSIGPVMLGSVTDAYQPCEADFGLTRSCLDALSSRPGVGVSILTKSPLVLRDIDLLRRWFPASKTGASSLSVGFTVTVVDEGTARAFEPGAPSPAARLEAARVLANEGIPVWIFVAPLLPGIGDTREGLERLLEAVARAGVPSIAFDRLNPYARSVSGIRGVYRTRFPYALPALESYLKDPRRCFAAAGEVIGSLARKIGVEVARV